MRRIPWNTCTTFAAVGSALAYALLIPIFEWHWQLIPGGIAGLIVAYATSTALGRWFYRIDIGRHPLLGVGAGLGAASVTLLFGALALTVANFLLETGVEIADAPSGQPFWNAVAQFAPHNAREFILEPVLTGLLYGQWPAFVLGFVYGATLSRKSPGARAPMAASSASAYLTSGGGVVIASLISVTAALVFDRDGSSRTHVPVGVPVAIGGCGSAQAPGGVLGYCPGSPCAQGYCDWDTDIDALAVYVRGPEDDGWRWTGGGMGNTTSPHIVRHRTSWVQTGPDGRFDASNPHRSASYGFRLDGDNVRFGNESFAFRPGMLFVVRYLEDWSYTVDVGREALADTGVTVDQLQRSLDRVCAALGQLCDQGFRISE